MSPLPVLGQKPWDQVLNNWLLVGHDVNGNNLAAASDATKVDKDSIVVAATRVVANKLLAGDANPAFQVKGDGQMSWGVGGATAVDLLLYRSSVGVLKTDQNFRVQNYLDVDFGGTGAKLRFGSAVDTTLYRSAAAVLRTDGQLYALSAASTPGLGITLAAGDAQPTVGFVSKQAGTLGAAGIQFGAGGVTAADTFLYRDGVSGRLRTNARLYVDDNVYIGQNISVPNLYFGSALDTSLSRPGAQTLNINAWAKVLSPLTTGIRVQVTGTTGLIFEGLVGGDTTNRIQFRASDGGIQWSPGNAAVDTNLYRSGVGVLQTDGLLIAAAGFNAAGLATAGTAGYQSSVTGDTVTRYVLAADGRMQWGPGNAALDTNLYRYQGTVLKTDGGMYFGGAPSAAGVQIGAGGQVGIYRAAASGIPFYLNVVGDTVNRFQSDPNGLLQWGPGGSTAVDTTLERFLAGTLRVTAGSLLTGSVTATTGGSTGAGGWIAAGGAICSVRTAAGPAFTSAMVGDTGTWRYAVDNTGKLQWGDGIIATADTNLYRSAAGDLKTDGRFLAVSDLIARIGATQQVIVGDDNAGHAGIRFGSAGDTNLYRSAANFLKTDGGLQVGATVQLNIGNTNGVIIGYDGVNPARGLAFINDAQNAWDTNLYRTAAGILKTDGGFAAAAGAGLYAFYAAQTGDTQNRLLIGVDGKHQWGPGNVAVDTNLYRSAASVLTTDGTLQASTLEGYGATAIGVRPGAGATYRFWILNSGAFKWAPAGTGVSDTDLSRESTGKLITNSQFYSYNANGIGTDGNMRANIGTARIDIGAVGPSSLAAVLFGTDTNLYRSAAGVLKTDGVLNAVGGLQVNGVAVGGGAPTPATTLPGSPANGQQAILVDSTTAPTYSWLMQYSSAAAKWLFIGGSPLEFDSPGATTYNFTTASYVVFGTGLTVPRAGVYQIDYGSGAYISAAGVQPIWLTAKLGAAAAADADGVRDFLGNGVANAVFFHSRSIRRTLAASDVVQLACRLAGTGATGVVESAWLKIEPVTLT